METSYEHPPFSPSNGLAPQRLENANGASSSSRGHERRSGRGEAEKNERAPASSVYIYFHGQVNIPGLMRRIEELVSPAAIRGTSWREKQKFGFIDLVSNEDADRIVSKLNGADIDGSKIVVEFSRGGSRPSGGRGGRAGSGHSGTAPLHPSPAPATISDYRAEGGTLTSSPTAVPNFAPTAPSTAISSSVAEEKANSLVLKNLPFNLVQADFMEWLNSFEMKPEHVKFHVDAGAFRGIVFVKYRSVEEAQHMYGVLSAVAYGSRRLRVEFKRKLLIKESELEDEEFRATFNRLSEFKEHPHSSVLSFPAFGLSSQQRRQLHAIAERLGLAHFTQGEGEYRTVVIAKKVEKATATEAAPETLPIGENAWRPRSQQGSEKGAKPLLFQPTRQPRGPDGSTGFSEEYRNARRLMTNGVPFSVSSLPAANAPPAPQQTQPAADSATKSLQQNVG